MRAIFATLGTLVCTLSLLGIVGTAYAQEPGQTPEQVPAQESAQTPTKTPQTEKPAPKLQGVPPAEPVVREVTPQPLYRSFWLETGLGYKPGEGGLEARPRVGVRGIQPLTDTVALYAALGVDTNLSFAVGNDLAFVLDVGGWYSFLPGADDLFGFRSYAGTGLSYVSGSFGLALSAALSYELSTQTAVVAVYTHRPLFFPELTQAFDLSFGVSFTLR